MFLHSRKPDFSVCSSPSSLEVFSKLSSYQPYLFSVRVEDALSERLHTSVYNSAVPLLNPSWAVTSSGSRSSLFVTAFLNFLEFILRSGWINFEHFEFWCRNHDEHRCHKTHFFLSVPPYPSDSFTM